MAWRSYPRLIRFHFHLNFISVPLGAMFAYQGVSTHLVGSLLLLYVSFNVLLYGGIYTLNAVADIRSDERHPTKRKRPLPAGEISLTSAILFSIIMLTAGLISGVVFFGRVIFFVYVAFLGVNIFYNLVAREIPYLDIAVNGATHPLRFLMGVLLVKGQVPYLLLLAVFFLAFGMSGVRRIIERDVKGYEARKTLESYSDQALFMLKVFPSFAIILLLVVDTSIPRVFYGAALMIYLVLAFGPDFSRTLRRSLLSVWTR